MRRAVWVLPLLLACSTTSVVSDDLDYPLLDIQKAVNTQTPGGIATTNPNQREFTSNYVVSDRGDMRQRSIISILGDRRPYQINVEVEVDKLLNKQWKPIQARQESAKAIQQRLLDYLSKTSQKNLIDHFRPF